MKFLSADQVVAMHDVLLERWGGEEGGGHRGDAFEGAEAAVQAVKNSYYEGMEDLAAAYAVYIIQGHVFMDGNKRTGAAAMMTFFVLNGGKGGPTQRALQMATIEVQTLAESGARTDALVERLARLLRKKRRP
jgi:death-on-curing protein